MQLFIHWNGRDQGIHSLLVTSAVNTTKLDQLLLLKINRLNTIGTRDPLLCSFEAFVFYIVSSAGNVPILNQGRIMQHLLSGVGGIF